MSDADRQALARAAGLGDLVAARKLVSVLEREKNSEWMPMHAVVRRRPGGRLGFHGEDGQRRGVVVSIGNYELARETLEAWRREDVEQLVSAMRGELSRIPGLPTDVELGAVWDEPAWAEIRAIVFHPSFAPVHAGDQYPRFATE